MADRTVQVKQSADCVEKDRLDHSSQTFHSGEIASKRPVRKNSRAGSSTLRGRARLDDVCHNSVMLPVEHNDPINAKILAISEDKIEGFVREPFQEIANRSGLGVDVVMTRIGAMLRAGTIR